jgi:hypothetical protein
MGGAGRLTLPGLLQTLSAVLSDGLQEAVAIFRSLDNHHEGLVNEPADDLKDIQCLDAVLAADRFDRLQGAGAHEHRQAPQHVLFHVAEQVVTPVHRRP